MAEEAKGTARYVYVQTVGHLWRFDREGEDSHYDDSVALHGAGEVKKGVLTKLIDFQREGLPLAAGGFACDSKLYFVGGETVKPHSTPPPPLPIGYNARCKEVEYVNQNCDISLNKRVFVFDQFSDSNSEPSLVRSEFESESLAPKVRPFVIPVNNGDKTLFYVISATPVFYKSIVYDDPIMEVYDPVLNLWKSLEPHSSNKTYSLPVLFAFLLDRKIFVRTRAQEFVFNLDTNKWEKSKVFDAWANCLCSPCMLPVGDGILLGCWSYLLRAFKLCSKPEHGTRGGLVRHQRIQGLSELCAPYWPTHSIPSSTLCNLGDGYMLFVSTSLCPERKNLHFYFVTFRVHKYSPNDKKRVQTQFPNAPDNFVSVEAVAYCHRVVPCEGRYRLNCKVLQAYVL